MEAWLLVQQRARVGAYTSMRTTQCSQAVLCFEQHIHRLAESCRHISGAPAVSEHVLRPLVVQSVREALRAPVERRPGSESKIAVFVGSHLAGEDQQLPCFVAAKAWELLSPPSPPVAVQVFEASRANMGASKDIAWVERRKLLTFARPSFNEALLMEKDGRILEGASSNFFVVTASGSVQTASLEEKVLAGTIRTIVLDASKHGGIDVIQSAPHWNARADWIAAFITSTSRLVLPIDEIWFAPSDTGSAEIYWHAPPSAPAVISSLRASVEAELAKQSTILLE